MIGHDVKCEICNKYAEREEAGLDMPPPDDKLCRACRKAVKDAREHREQVKKES